MSGLNYALGPLIWVFVSTVFKSKDLSVIHLHPGYFYFYASSIFTGLCWMHAIYFSRQLELANFKLQLLEDMDDFDDEEESTYMRDSGIKKEMRGSVETEEIDFSDDEADSKPSNQRSSQVSI